MEGKLFSHQSYKFYYYKLHFCLNTSIFKYVCNSLIFSFSLINKLFYHINVSFYILFDLQKLGNTFNTHSGIKNWGLYLIFFCIFWKIRLNGLDICTSSYCFYLRILFLTQCFFTFFDKKLNFSTLIFCRNFSFIFFRRITVVIF